MSVLARRNACVAIAASAYFVACGLLLRPSTGPFDVIGQLWFAWILTVVAAPPIYGVLATHDRLSGRHARLALWLSFGVVEFVGLVWLVSSEHMEWILGRELAGHYLVDAGIVYQVPALAIGELVLLLSIGLALRLLQPRQTIPTDPSAAFRT